MVILHTAGGFIDDLVIGLSVLAGLWLLLQLSRARKSKEGDAEDPDGARDEQSEEK